MTLVANSCRFAGAVYRLVIHVTSHFDMMTHKATDSLKIAVQVLRVMMQC